MSIYFIYKHKTQSNHFNLVANTYQQNAAIKLIKKEALRYVMKKNQRLFDATGQKHEENKPKNIKVSDVKFFIQDSPDEVNVIDVFLQQKHKISGWTGSTYKEKPIKIAQFSYTKYELKDLMCKQCNTVMITPVKSLMMGKINPALIQDLKKCSFFVKRKEVAENNSINSDKLTFDLNDETLNNVDEESIYKIVK